MDRKIMIVDDEPDVLESLKTILENNCYKVITVESGLKCIDELENGFQGIILMDLMMPDMDGWDTIKEIVERGLIDNVAIEIITGKGARQHEDMEMLGSYIFDYLSKPIEMEELIKSLEECNRFLAAKKNT